MTTRLAVVMVALLLAAGCAMPRWVPFLGKRDPQTAAAPEAPAEPPRPALRTLEAHDAVADRVIAVVNNDAITLGELQESLLAYRQENRGRAGLPSDEALSKEFLTKLIDSRLQLQEAEREKIVVDDQEVDDELRERIKRYGVSTFEEFEALIKPQGVTLESIKKRLREGLRISKVVRRKVALRVSVTEQEITQYLEDNRGKLETGLAYHARHILIVPESGASDAAWEGARIKAELLRAQLLDGGDFADLARQHSRDASARDGGDLGPLKRGELAQDIEARILALEPGELSVPYRSALGYHLFRLESKDTLAGGGLARARQQIRDILFRQKYEIRLEAWLKEIKQRAIIEVRM